MNDYTNDINKLRDELDAANRLQLKRNARGCGYALLGVAVVLLITGWLLTRDWAAGPVHAPDPASTLDPTPTPELAPTPTSEHKAVTVKRVPKDWSSVVISCLVAFTCIIISWLYVLLISPTTKQSRETPTDQQDDATDPDRNSNEKRMATVFSVIVTLITFTIALYNWLQPPPLGTIILKDERNIEKLLSEIASVPRKDEIGRGVVTNCVLTVEIVQVFVREFPNVDQLTISDSEFRARAFAELGGMERLRELAFSDSQLTNYEMSVLKKLFHLQKLDVSGNPRITDVSIPMLTSPNELRELNIRRTGISRDGENKIHRFFKGQQFLLKK